jgi:pyruvate formate lyase activating enzyme
MALKVHSIESFSTHDGPGIRTVIFLQGCNFVCSYCHNPDTQSYQSSSVKLLSVADVVKILKKNQDYFGVDGGLTVSGGEPTLQISELIKLFEEVSKIGINIVLDTNGSLLSPDLKELYELSDLVIFDLKHFFNQNHMRLTGCENLNTLQNIEVCERIGKDYWVRLVLVPGWTDDEKHLHAWAKHFEKAKYLKRVEILPYHTMGAYKYGDLGKNYLLDGVRAADLLDVNRAKKIMAHYLGDKLT